MRAQFSQRFDVLDSLKLGESSFAGLVSGERRRHMLVLIVVNAVSGVDEGRKRNRPCEPRSLGASHVNVVAAPGLDLFIARLRF